MVLDKDIFQLSRNTPRPPCDCVYGECKKEITQCADISLPVEIKPTATVGRIDTECCGDPVICCHEHSCNSCEITITQKICVKIPVTFSALTCVEEPVINCCTGESCRDK